jgi:hypothetical protein
MNTNMRGLGRGAQGNRNMNTLGRGLGGRSQSQVVIRTKLRVGFSYPAVAPTQVTARLANTLNMPAIQTSGSPLSVSTASTDQGTVVVLRGTVATAEDRMVAEQLALLEPGISKVQNELTVATPPASEPLPGPLPVPPAPSGSPGSSGSSG